MAGDSGRDALRRAFDTLGRKSSECGTIRKGRPHGWWTYLCGWRACSTRNEQCGEHLKHFSYFRACTYASENFECRNEYARQRFNVFLISIPMCWFSLASFGTLSSNVLDSRGLQYLHRRGLYRDVFRPFERTHAPWTCVLNAACCFLVQCLRAVEVVCREVSQFESGSMRQGVSRKFGLRRCG